jgi:hypothetical protein
MARYGNKKAHLFADSFPLMKQLWRHSEMLRRELMKAFFVVPALFPGPGLMSLTVGSTGLLLPSPVQAEPFQIVSSWAIQLSVSDFVDDQGSLPVGLLSAEDEQMYIADMEIVHAEGGRHCSTLYMAGAMSG